MYEAFMIGLADIMQIGTLLYILMGVCVGILFGASPGLSTSMGMAFMLPITFFLDATTAIALLIGLYIGGASGGLITAILINIPGTPASVATTFDGYPMAQRGEGGRAIRIGTLYSLLGGMFSLLVLFFISPLLARAALKFGPPEYFSIAFFSLTLIASLSGKSILKGAISATIGVMFTTVGMAPVDSVRRYTFGVFELDGGFKLLSVLVGVFAVMEVIKAAENPVTAGMRPMSHKTAGIGVSWKEFTEQFRNFFVSSCIGTGIGILPGLGAAISNLIAYSVSKNTSRHPEKYGTGVIDGIIASETANNAVSGGALVPLLTMGIPGDAGTAMLLAAFMLHGITPGPLLFSTHGHIIYAMFVILIVANIMMFLIQIWGLSLFLKLLEIPRNILFPIIMVLASIGAFAMNNRVFDIWSIFIFALVGYGLSKFKFPAAPLVLGFVLGPMLELYLRRGLMSTYGSIWSFFTRPISGTVLVLTILVILYTAYTGLRDRRGRLASEE